MLHVRWRQHALLAVGAYAVLAVAFSAVLLTLRAHTADHSGLGRRVFPGVGFAGEPLLDDFSPTVTLGFLDDDPALPQQFFSARWQGFWYVPEAGDYDIHGSGDDRLDIWIDGVLVIRRFPPSEMHTVVRTISLDAGLHDIGIGYEQHGGAHSLRLGWSLPGRRANPLPAHRLFPNRPSVLDLRLASAAAWFDTIILMVWIVPAVIGGACLGWRAWVARAADARAPLEGMLRSVPGALFAVVLLMGTVHNLSFVHRYPDTRACCNLGIDTATYDDIAWNIVETGRLEVPVRQPPGFVLFLAGVYRFAGHDFLTPKILLVLMVSAIAAGTWWLGCCYVGVWEGLVAGGLVVVSPMFRAYAATLQYEIPVTLLFLVTCLLLFRGLRATPLRRSLLLFSAAACAAAACALTREIFLAVFPLLLIAVWTNWSGTRRHRLAVVCVMSGLFCFLVGCWIAWQYHTHGQLVPISNKGPFNFWIGNNPNATGLYNLHFGPLGRPRGWAFIQEQPADALALAGRKFLYFWGIANDGWHVPNAVPIWLARLTLGAISLEWIQAVVRSAIPLFCLGGITIMLRRSAFRQGLWVLPVAIALLAGIHCAMISSYRFAMPVLPYIFLFAAVALVATVRAGGRLAARNPRAALVAFAGVGGAWAAVLMLAQPPAVTYRIEAEELEGPATVVVDVLADNGVSRLHGRTGDRELVGILPAKMFPAGHPVVHISARSTGERSQEILEVRLADYERGAECSGRLAWLGSDDDRLRSYRRLSLACPYLPQRLSFMEIWALGTSDVWIDSIDIDFQQTPSLDHWFGTGWYPEETASGSTRRWTGETATLSFRNPKADATFHLDYTARPALFPGAPQVVTISASNQVLQSFVAGEVGRQRLQIPIPAAAFGPGDITEIRIRVDRTFVPANVIAGSRDARELGILVHHAAPFPPPP